MNKVFSIKEAVKYGFETTKKNLKFLIPIMLISAAVNFIPPMFTQGIKQDGGLPNIIVNLVEWVLSSLISLGLIKVSLNFIDSKKSDFDDLFKHYKLLLNFLAASILYGLIVGVGFILLVVPGIIWAIKLQFFSYYIADKGLGPIEALKQSWNLTRGMKWKLFLFNSVLGAINLLGALALVVGLLISVPTTMLASAYVFRKITKESSTTAS